MKECTQQSLLQSRGIQSFPRRLASSPNFRAFLGLVKDFNKLLKALAPSHPTGNWSYWDKILFCSSRVMPKFHICRIPLKQILFGKTSCPMVGYLVRSRRRRRTNFFVSLMQNWIFELLVYRDVKHKGVFVKWGVTFVLGNNTKEILENTGISRY